MRQRSPKRSEGDAEHAISGSALASLRAPPCIESVIISERSKGILLADPPAVTVELFGIARHRAGRSEVVVHGKTILDILIAVREICPQLSDLFAESGSVTRQYLVSLDGERFIDDLREMMPAESRLLILGADPGG